MAVGVSRAATVFEAAVLDGNLQWEPELRDPPATGPAFRGRISMLQCGQSAWNIPMAQYSFTTPTPYGVLAIGPEVYVNSCAFPPATQLARLIVQPDMLLYAGTALNQAAAQTIATAAGKVPPPAIYAPDETFSGDMATIVDRLRQNMGLAVTSEMQTDHLASRIGQ